MDFLRIIQSGIPGPNEIGPHAMPLGMGYSVTVFQNHPLDVIKEVNLTILIDKTTGIITCWKAGRTPAFSGRVEVR